ncbi:hypothetical protein HGH92_23625 [Chitinophaga varians]|uniref:Uncharacterized protein n=1 Tax=Chitinophaga varians TaxID=2202339 RepID=A0A847S1N8_9BACT|nr:hypothetical protein [Chitinophaga varians]NLR67315.1 hypothetical protein [Chitinophaga varians]
MITWTTYLLWLGLLLVIYYGVVHLFFRVKGGSILKRKRRVEEKKAADSVLFKEPDGDGGDQNAATMAPVHSLVDELQAFVAQAGKEGMEKAELLTGIKMLLKKYPRTKGSIYQNGITNLVEVIAESQCGIHLSAGELSALWDE